MEIYFGTGFVLGALVWMYATVKGLDKQHPDAMLVGVIMVIFAWPFVGLWFIVGLFTGGKDNGKTT